MFDIYIQNVTAFRKTQASDIIEVVCDKDTSFLVRCSLTKYIDAFEGTKQFKKYQRKNGSFYGKTFWGEKCY